MSERYDLNEVAWPDVSGFDLRQHMVLAMKRGSEAHGTYLPPTEPDSIDDRDIMAVIVPPVRYYFGLSHFEGKDSFKGCWDVVTYEMRKFVSLLCKQNPNVVGMLWLRPEDYLYVSPEGRFLIDNRLLFRAKRPAYDSFVGYSRGQLRRMTHFTFQGYMGAKRKGLVEKYGYDCKNAAHLIRLLAMAVEYLKTGEMIVYREKDREKLIEIKTGKWGIQRVLDESTRLFGEAESALATSPLPEEIDREAVDRLTCALVRSALERKGTL